MVGHSDEFHCIVKPNPAIIEAIQTDAHVAFSVNHGFPTQMLQGVGRAFYLGGLDLHPQLREQTLAKIPEATAFLTTIRNLGVLKIVPNHIAMTDDTNLGLGPRPVYIPEATRALPGRRRRWMQALGIKSWPLVLIPVIVATLLASHVALDVAWWLLLPVCLAALLIHVGTLLLATDTGFRRHRERSAALGANRLLHEGLLSTHQVLQVGLLCLALGSLVGLFLVGLRGAPLLAIGFVGVVGSFAYAGWPFTLSPRWLEDVAIFVGLGPLLVLGALNVLTGRLHLLPVLVSLPLACLAESIFYASHLQTFSADLTAKVRTLAVMLGWERARRLMYALVGMPYVLVALLILGGGLPAWAWLTLLSLPFAGRSILPLWRATADRTQALAGLDRQVFLAYVAFGVLLICSLVLG
jgi:1,4-dihydroxy-2-naphthoate octaprenyltransferase